MEGFPKNEITLP